MNRAKEKPCIFVQGFFNDFVQGMLSVLSGFVFFPGAKYCSTYTQSDCS